jgi:DNA-binding response OmpR family regulator
LAKVLVVESDSVFAAVLADRLHVAGHEVRRLSDGARAAAMAQEQGVDLVVLGDSPNSGLPVVETLRGQPATRSVPLLILSAQSAPADRVAALRAGADDYLSRPCDLDELLLRLDRLLANRTAALQVLQGDLANHPLWALLQYLGQVRKSGILRVKAESGAGTIEMRDGEPAAARWEGELRGREALLALLSLEEGGFRFDPMAPGLPVEAVPGLPLQELLMHSAWLKDEIGKRRHHLPPTGQPLQAMSTTLPQIEGGFHTLPLRRVFERTLQRPGVRLFDLIADEAEAPISTRLAVALLIEHGVLAPQSAETDAELQNTREISSGILFELAIEDLLESAAGAGFTSTALPYLLLVEPAVWPDLRRLLEQAPGFHQNENLRRLVEQVELRRAGSATFPSKRGKLSLHVQVLTGTVQPQVNAIVPGCAGILVWIRGSESLDGVRAVVQRLEASGPRGAAGMVVAGAETASRETGPLLRGAARWRSTPHEPQSLLGLLRLLHPDGR